MVGDDERIFVLPADAPKVGAAMQIDGDFH